MSATIISPKQSLNQMKIKIPKAIAQHFPDVQGDNIDNNKEAKEKKADGLKKEEPSKATSRSEAKDEKSLPIIDEKESLRANKK